MFAGSSLDTTLTLNAPENGLIAVNVPLDPPRLGALSTRTTHPFYIGRWNEVLQELGLNCRIENPYWDKTKGEMVAACSNGALLRHLIPASLSCASPTKGRWQRRRELVDGLVDLLIQVVHRLSVRAEKRTTTEMVGELQHVQGKTGILFCIAQAALQNPEGSVREVRFPLVGETTLATLVEESQAKPPTFRQRVERRIHRSYAHHYRRMLPLILSALVFRSNNSRHRPLIEALGWLNAHWEDRRNLIP